METFVDKESVVRQIWGKSDTILFIFAGAAAEFALNKAVDWLYFTGRLPADPLARLFSTVTYARRIVFSDLEKAHKAIDSISSIHKAVELSREDKIPDWAYRDVLFMLIHYSIAAYELLERKLSPEEKEELFQTFYRIGARMEIPDLPRNYEEWILQRDEHLERDLVNSKFTVDLFRQYRKHLGAFRYRILIEGQILIVPPQVRKLLGMRKQSLVTPLLLAYKISRALKMDRLVKSLILPREYMKQINAMDIV